MGIFKEAFGWVTGVKDQSLEALDVATMESKLRATNRLKEMWDREIKKAEIEYRDTVSVEANASRSPIARKLAFQRGAIVARRIKTLMSASAMLGKMAGVVEQLKMLKVFYKDMCETMALPKGLNMEQVVRQIYTMSDITADKRNELDTMMQTLDDASSAISEQQGDDEIEKTMGELNALYDEYKDKLAMNDTMAAEEVKTRIEAKKAQMDKQMGLATLV